MAEKNRLDRRAFIRNAGIGVLASAVGPHTTVEAGVPPLVLPQDAGYDFDTVYDRIGTDCSIVGRADCPIRSHRRRHGYRRPGLQDRATHHPGSA